MTTNYVQAGDRIKYKNTGSAISSGDVVVVGNLVGIAEEDIAATSGEGTVVLVGVYTKNKKSGQAFGQGQELYWDSGNKELTSTESGNTFIGHAHEAAGSSDTTANVKLSSSTAAAQAAHVADMALSDLDTSDTYTDAAVNAIFAEVETKFNALVAAMENAGLIATS